jgi:hypothetical protein
MSSKASTTIGFERRFNPRSRASSPTSSTRARAAAAAAAEHGADRRAQPRRARRRAAAARARGRVPEDAIVLDVRPTGRSRPVTGPAPSASRSRLELRDEGGVRPAERPLVLHARTRRRLPRVAVAARGRPVRTRGLAGGRRRREARARSRSTSSSSCSPTTPSSCSTCARPTSGTRSHIPGSQHLPYRTARAAPKRAAQTAARS